MKLGTYRGKEGQIFVSRGSSCKTGFGRVFWSGPDLFVVVRILNVFDMGLF